MGFKPFLQLSLHKHLPTHFEVGTTYNACAQLDFHVSNYCTYQSSGVNSHYILFVFDV